MVIQIAKMLLQILFNPISLITSLLSAHSMYYNSLSEVDVESEYTKAGFVTDNFYLLKSDTEMIYNRNQAMMQAVGNSAGTPVGSSTAFSDSIEWAAQEDEI